MSQAYLKTDANILEVKIDGEEKAMKKLRDQLAHVNGVQVSDGDNDDEDAEGSAAPGAGQVVAVAVAVAVPVVDIDRSSGEGAQVREELSPIKESEQLYGTP